MENYRVYEKAKKTRQCSYYMAENRLNNQIVTIKKLSSKYIWEEVLSRKDIALMKLSKYDFLPSIQEIIRQNNKFFIVLEKLTNNLDDFKNQKNLQLDQIVNLSIKLLEAIDTLASKESIIMTEIRPQQFFYDAGILKLGHIQSIPKKEIVQLDLVELQDLKYVAPESVLSNKQPDQKSAVFSIGCIIAELITNQCLVNAKTKIDYIYRLTELFPKEIQKQKKGEGASFQKRMSQYCAQELIKVLSDMLKIDKSERLTLPKSIECLKKLDKRFLKPLQQIEHHQTIERQQTEKNIVQKIDQMFQKNKSDSRVLVPKVVQIHKVIEAPKNSKQHFQNQIHFNFQNQDNSTIDKVLEMLKLTQPLKSEKNVDDDVTQAIIIKKSEGGPPQLPTVKLKNLKAPTKKLAGKPQLTNFALNDKNLGVKLGSSFFSQNQNMPF